jgi:hypothetical protein
MLRNVHFLPQNNGNHSESIPRNIFGTKFCSQPYPALPCSCPAEFCPRLLTSQSQIPEAKFLVLLTCKVRLYSQLRHRVPNTIYLFEYSLCSVLQQLLQPSVTALATGPILLRLRQCVILLTLGLKRKLSVSFL